MTIDQIRAVLEQRSKHYRTLADTPGSTGMLIHYLAQRQSYDQAVSLLDLIDGKRGPCPKCGGRMGSRLPDGSWRCAGLSSYAVLASENCGHVYEPNHGAKP